LNGISAADLFSFQLALIVATTASLLQQLSAQSKATEAALKQKDKRKLKLNFMRSYEYIQSHVMLQVSSDIFHVFKIFV
jgi:hypothetical protein